MKKMKKIYILWIIGVLLVGMAIGAGLKINLSEVEVNPSTDVSISTKEVNFKCDSKTINLNGTEPDGIYDDNDIVSLVSVCNGIASEITIDGLIYSENKYGLRGFNQTYLKENECEVTNQTYDSKINECI